MERLLARQCAAIYDLQPKVGLPAWKGGHPMSRKVADVLWEMLANARRLLGRPGNIEPNESDGSVFLRFTGPARSGCCRSRERLANEGTQCGPVSSEGDTLVYSCRARTSRTHRQNVGPSLLRLSFLLDWDVNKDVLITVKRYDLRHRKQMFYLQDLMAQCGKITANIGK